MNKILLPLVLALTQIGGPVSFPNEEVLIPPKENPYCNFVPNKTVPTPGIETIVCPDDAPEDMMYVVSEACYMSFSNLFQEEVSIVYNDACSDWKAATRLWRDGMDTALLTFSACIAAIQPGPDFQKEFNICRNKYNRAVNSHLKKFNQKTNEISKKADDDIKSLRETFMNTVAGTCCVLVPKERR